MNTPDWAHGVDTDKPSTARMYDYWLGGSHNFAADRVAAEQILAIRPEVRYIARANRAFVQRAVRYLARAGVRQFLDLGSGIPTRGTVHEIARSIVPDARVVYVDIDPVVVAHSTSILQHSPGVVAVTGDVRQPEAILSHPDVRTGLDLTRPVGLLFVSVLHFVAGDEAYRVVGRFRDAVAPGSYLAVSHVAPEPFTDDEVDRIVEVLTRSTTPDGGIRDREQVARFFDGFQLVDPGLVWLSQWRPDDGELDLERPERSGMLAAVARKPA